MEYGIGWVSSVGLKDLEGHVGLEDGEVLYVGVEEEVEVEVDTHKGSLLNH